MVDRLDNGMAFVHEYMPAVETVTMKIAVKAGLRNETFENNGISHFLEHMAFKGTEKRDARQIANDFESLGAVFNAYTSKEVTAYYSKVLREYTEQSLEILSDMFENSVFDPVELERERGVILQELAMINDTPDDVINDYYQSTAFRDQIFGQSIVGTSENIEKFQRQDFLDYINSNYVAEDTVISIAGRVEYGEALALANRYFRGSRRAPKKPFQVASYTGGYFKRERDLEQVQCILGFEGTAFSCENRFVMSVMNNILGSSMSSRLFQEVRENKGLCYSIYSFNDPSFETGSFQICTAVDPECLSRAVEAIVLELRKMVSDVRESELARAKIQLKSNVLMNLESTTNRASSNANGLIFRGRIETMEEIADKIDSIRVEDVEQLLAKIVSGRPTIAAYGRVDGLLSYDELREKILA
ncbi:MAG: insulinase family protein [Rickettsiales bacterium]|nr:insulinase family protein [Rickettsiales bacterium]